MEEDPLAAAPVPTFILTEGSEARTAGEVKAESPRRAWRRARFGQRFAFDGQRFVLLGGAGLLYAPGRRGQQGELRSRAFAVEQRGKLPEPQVGAGVGPLTL